MCKVRMYLCVVYGIHLPSLALDQLKLFCVHPVSGEQLDRRLEVHQDELMLVAMKRAYEVNSQNCCMTLHLLYCSLSGDGAVYSCLHMSP